MLGLNLCIIAREDSTRLHLLGTVSSALGRAKGKCWDKGGIIAQFLFAIPKRDCVFAAAVFHDAFASAIADRNIYSSLLSATARSNVRFSSPIPVYCSRWLERRSGCISSAGALVLEIRGELAFWCA